MRTEVKPDYSVEAMKNRKEGMVTMDAVVLPDGWVGPVRVIKSLDLDLDQAAVATIRQVAVSSRAQRRRSGARADRCRNVVFIEVTLGSF